MFTSCIRLFTRKSQYSTWFTFQSQPPTYTDINFTQIHTPLLRSSTTLQSLLEAAPFTSSCLYLFYLTPATVPAFDAPILRQTAVSGCDSTLLAYSRLLPSLITRKPAISQQRRGITIQVHKTESPTRSWANTAIHFNKDVPSGNRGKMIGKKRPDKERWSEMIWMDREKDIVNCCNSINVCTSHFVSVRYGRLTQFDLCSSCGFFAVMWLALLARLWVWLQMGYFVRQASAVS